MILWTRVTPRDPSTTQSIQVRWHVGVDPALRRIVASGVTETGPEIQHDIKFVDPPPATPGTTPAPATPEVEKKPQP